MRPYRSPQTNSPSRPTAACRCLCAVVMLLGGMGAACAADGAGNDWPHWRGPERDGSIQESGAAIVEDASQATHVWTSEADLPSGPSDGDHGVTGFDGGAASPVYSDGRIYLYYCLGDPDLVDEEKLEKKRGDARFGNDYYCRAYASLVADDIMHCFEAATGKTLWVRRWERASTTTYKGPWSTPCVADGRVFSVGNCGMVYACDAGTGEELWRRQIDNGHMLEARFETDRAILIGEQHGDGPVTAPAVIGGVLLCGNGSGGMTAYDPATGVVRWRSGGFDTRAPFLGWTSGGRELIIAGGVCFDPADGSRLWSTDRMRGVAVSGDRLVGYAVRDKRVQGHRIDASGHELVWQLPERYRSWRTDECVFYRDRVYLNCYTGRETSRSPEDYIVVCVDPADGTVLAEAPSPVPMRSYVGLYAGEGRIFYSGANPVAMWKADPADFRPLGVFEPDMTFCVAPIIVDGRLYYRGYSHLQCFDLRQRHEAMDVPADAGGLASRYDTTRLAAAVEASKRALLDAAVADGAQAATAASVLLARARGWAMPRKRALADGRAEQEIRLRSPGFAADDAAQLRAALAKLVQARRFGQADDLCAILAAIDGLEAPDAAAALAPVLDAARASLPPHEAAACARALGSSRSPAALPGLERLAGHDDAAVRNAVALALARCGSEDAQAMQTLADLVARPDAGPGAGRALVVLVREGADGAPSRAALLRGLAHDDSVVRVYAMLATQVRAAGAPELQVAIIRAGLTGRKVKTALDRRLDHVVRDICKDLGPDMEPGLRQALADQEWLDRCSDSAWTRQELEKLLGGR